MANTSFNQISQIMNSICEQATGKAQITPTNTSEFMSVATTALSVGYDAIMNAISKVLQRTIFSTRAYSGKFPSLRADSQRWGAVTRKLNLIDGSFDDDPSYELEDGVSVDMYKVNLPKPLQVNFYGSNVFKKYYTILLDQIDEAFQGPDQFASFMGMVTQNNADIITQAKESVRRATVANLIGACTQFGNTEQKIHLLTEYNTATGLSLTATTVFQPANYRAFMQWVYARINTLSEMMTERSLLYHLNITGKPITRHTPKSMQNVYLYTPIKYQAIAMADANTFNDQLVGFANNESVNYWQSIDTPDTINVKPAYLDVSDGSVKAYTTGVQAQKVFGVIFDQDCMGTTTISERTLATPVNADGKYYNLFHHFTERYWTDFTENHAVLYLD